MDIARMKESTRLELRRRCLASLYSFCIAVLGYDDMTEQLHREVCEFLEHPNPRKQLTLPRGFLKTCLASIAFPMWMSLPRSAPDEFPQGVRPDNPLYNLGTNIRILIASNVVTNASKIIGKIKKVYERNQAMMALFPEVIPHDFTKTKWSDLSAGIRRTEDYTEATFEAAGVGGSIVSRHYDLIIEDDLIYAKKDDLTGKELQPDQDDIDKAIGWHKLATSLFVPQKHVMLINVGTRWAKHDLVDHIRVNEKSYEVLDIPAVDENGPTWPELFDEERLESIAHAQGPYMYATQYLNKPMAPEDMLFRRDWLQFYTSQGELPKTMRIFTTVDLAGWGTAKRSRESRAVVLTCGWCHRNHCWLLHYDVGKFDPSEVIALMAKHWTLFKPEHIGVEEVYYQKALSHFARRAMEQGYILGEGGKKTPVPWMSIRALKPEAQKSKELRIRAIEPLASNLAIHCKTSHGDFLTEFCEYVPNNDGCKKDILDALAYQVQIARPGDPLPPKAKDRDDFMPLGTIDDFLKEAWSKNRPKNRFGYDDGPLNPFVEDWGDLTESNTHYFDEFWL